MVAHDLATRLSAHSDYAKGLGSPTVSERAQLHEADPVRVDREQLLAHRARLKAVHDESDTMVPAGSGSGKRKETRITTQRLRRR